MFSRIVLLVLLGSLSSVYGAASLPTLKVDKSAISVSGISSGAVMAVQFHVAFSSEIMGAGVIAGAPFLCQPQAACMTTPSLLSAVEFHGLTASARMFLNIDSTFNMAKDKIWIFAGTHDNVVKPAAGALVRDYYSLYVDSQSQIRLVNNINAAHGQPTNNYGGSCGDLHLDNYMNNCGYSAAYNLLNFIYGNLREPSASYVATGDLQLFDQSAFTTYSAHMDTVGYVYVPTGCKDRTKACKLHIAFHGCQMGRERIGDVYARHSGYNEVGEMNDIIILYPQVVVSALNPMGCWDWFAYTGIYYAFHSGPQMRSVHDMMTHISG
ncbi:poly(3-hydroxybutyrate) depolymerase-like [Physella acuta]|uniref:poly(3-hydroxybutyrate) depolymerase-like n=1 Tax=Physella acuta TaxID=109671 RepID=UPI0027DC0153|nr:poly(3-hydroxybutyrate) depolymerase-like [Physella acuta]